MITSKPSLIYYDCIFAREQKYPGIDSWSLINRVWGNNTCLIDRSHTVSMPMKTETLPWLELPKAESPKLDFVDTCYQQARAIWDRAKANDQEVAVMWSGGIDSTVALTSLLATADRNEFDKITVLLSRESVIEYPWFYHYLVKNKLKCGASDHWYKWVRPDVIFVTGEGGDQLVYGGFYPSRKKVLENTSLTNDSDSAIEILSYMTRDQKAAGVCYEKILEPMKKTCPVDLEHPLSVFWWAMFCLDWQSRYLTLLNNLPSFKANAINDQYMENNWIMFFQSEQLQNWAMHNQHVFLTGDLDNKKELKKVILEYTQDLDYFENKTKKSSMMNIKRSRPARAGINRQWQQVSDLSVYVEHDNSFV